MICRKAPLLQFSHHAPLRYGFWPANIVLRILGEPLRLLQSSSSLASSLSKPTTSSPAPACLLFTVPYRTLYVIPFMYNTYSTLPTIAPQQQQQQCRLLDSFILPRSSQHDNDSIYSQLVPSVLFTCGTNPSPSTGPLRQPSMS